MNISWLLGVLCQWDMGWVETIGAWSAVVYRRCTCMYVPFTTLYTSRRTTFYLLRARSMAFVKHESLFTSRPYMKYALWLVPHYQWKVFRENDWGVHRRKYMRSWVFDLRALIKGTNLFSYFNCCPWRLVWSNSSC
jgi:hypothetical protein